MSYVTFPREAEYHAKVARLVTQWAEAHDEDARVFERLACDQLGLSTNLPDDPKAFRRQVVQARFTELVREQNGWPTYPEWIRGQRTTSTAPKYLPQPTEVVP